MAGSSSTGWVPGAGRPAGAAQQAPVTGPPSCQPWDNQHGQEPGWRRDSTDCIWLLAAWSSAVVQQYTSQGGLQDLKTLNYLQPESHHPQSSSSNHPDPICSHLHLLQVLHHWQQCNTCFSSRAFHHQLHLCLPLSKPPLLPVISPLSPTPLPLAIMVPVSLLVPSPAHHLPTGRSVPLEPPCPSCQDRNLLSNPHMHFILNSKCPVPETLGEVHLSPVGSQLIPCLFCPHPREDLNVTRNTKGFAENILMLYLKLECKCYVRHPKYIGEIK